MTRFGSWRWAGQREHALVARPVLADEARPDRRRGAPAGRSGRRRGRSGRRRAGGTSSRSRRPAAAAHREAGRQRHRVLLGDPDIDEPIRELGLEAFDRPVPVGMPAVIADDPPVRAGQLDQLGDEDRRVVRRLLRARRRRPAARRRRPSTPWASRPGRLGAVGTARTRGAVAQRRRPRSSSAAAPRRGSRPGPSRPAGSRGPSGSGRGR